MNKNKVRISYDDGAYWEITRTLSNSAGHTVPLAAGRVVFFGRLPSEPRRHRCEVVVSEEKDKGERPRMGEGGSVCRAAALISSSCVALHVRIWRMLPHIRVLDDLGECVIAIHVSCSAMVDRHLMYCLHLPPKQKKTSFMKLVSLRSRPDRRPPRGPRRRGAGRSHGASAVSVRSWMLRPLVQKNQSKALFFEVVTF